uniref:methyltransferase domain-containing protein n=1 Tax=uncultured Finegoldia sp. TaxID=328009 RepID=UPI00262F6EBA
KYFYDESINYTGIDLSNEMLSICSNKFRNIRLINQNLINLDLKEDFDFVFSTLDTINYILDESSLQELFVKIKNICNGVFIFDVNTPYKLIEVMGNNHFVYEYDDILYTWVNQYYEDENIVDFYIDFFLRQDNNLYKRLKENQTEKVYNLDSLKFMLYNSGFNDVNIIDFDDGKSLKDNTNRALFICY